MSRSTLETLQQVNDSIRCALIRLRPEHKHCSTIQPQDFSDLMADILRAAECLGRPLASTQMAAIESEMLEYRCNLEKLKNLLPELHGNLLSEKSRLETEQAHVAAAAAWARGSSRTL